VPNTFPYGKRTLFYTGVCHICVLCTIIVYMDVSRTLNNSDTLLFYTVVCNVPTLIDESLFHSDVLTMHIYQQRNTVILYSRMYDTYTNKGTL